MTRIRVDTAVTAALLFGTTSTPPPPPNPTHPLGGEKKTSEKSFFPTHCCFDIYQRFADVILTPGRIPNGSKCVFPRSCSKDSHHLLMKNVDLHKLEDNATMGTETRSAMHFCGVRRPTSNKFLVHLWNGNVNNLLRRAMLCKKKKTNLRDRSLHSSLPALVERVRQRFLLQRAT